MALHAQETGRAGGPGRFGRFGPIRIALIVSQLLTAVAFLVTLGGLSKLQKNGNALPLGTLNSNPATATVAAPLISRYNENFQNAGQVPYPTHTSWQFGLQWYILWLEVALFVWIGIMALLPGTILRLKHVAMCFLSYAFVLTTLQVNSLLYFNRTPEALATYGSQAIKTTLAGTIMGAVCNGFTIIFLGLIGTGHDFTGRSDVTWSQGGLLKRRNRNMQVQDAGTAMEEGKGVHPEPVAPASATAASTTGTGTGTGGILKTERV